MKINVLMSSLVGFCANGKYIPSFLSFIPFGLSAIFQ
jgi:hypothetical protein